MISPQLEGCALAVISVSSFDQLGCEDLSNAFTFVKMSSVGKASISNSNFTNSRIATTSGKGGGLDLEANRLDLLFCNFEANTLHGPFINLDALELNVLNGVVAHNTFFGSPFLQLTDKLEVGFFEFCTFVGNEASETGVTPPSFITTRRDFFFTGLTMESNTWPSNLIDGRSGVGTEFQDCVFRNNVGNIYVAPTGSIQSCVFDGNTGSLFTSQAFRVIEALFFNGRGANFGEDLTAVVEDTGATFQECVFHNNSHIGNGGAINTKSAVGNAAGFSKMTRCNFSENVAYGWGAAVEVGANTIFENCSFLSNQALYGDAGYEGAVAVGTSLWIPPQYPECYGEEGEGGNQTVAVRNSLGYVVASAQFLNCKFKNDRVASGGSLAMVPRYSNATTVIAIIEAKDYCGKPMHVGGSADLFNVTVWHQNTTYMTACVHDRANGNYVASVRISSPGLFYMNASLYQVPLQGSPYEFSVVDGSVTHTWYVDSVSGRDNIACGRFSANACQSIGYAASKALQNDRIEIAPGSYSGQMNTDFFLLPNVTMTQAPDTSNSSKQVIVHCDETASSIRLYTYASIEWVRFENCSTGLIDLYPGSKLYHCQFINNSVKLSHPTVPSYAYPGLVTVSSVGTDRAIIDNCTFQGNQVHNGWSLVHSRSPRALILRNVRFLGNQGGVPLYVGPGDPVIVEGCVFENNTSDDFAGKGIFVDGGSVSISDSMFSNNHGNFTIIYVLSNGQVPPGVFIHRCNFQYNRATSTSAVAIHVQSTDAILQCTDTMFRDNVGLDAGAGAVWSEGSVTFENCSFTRNEIKNRRHLYGGGAVFLQSSKDSELPRASFTNCLFADNRVAFANAGAVHLLKYGNATFENCKFDYNHGGVLGSGAVLHHGTKGIIIANCSFHGNFGQPSCVATHDAMVYGCHVSGNTVPAIVQLEWGYADLVLFTNRTTGILESHIAGLAALVGSGNATIEDTLFEGRPLDSINNATKASAFLAHGGVSVSLVDVAFKNHVTSQGEPVIYLGVDTNADFTNVVLQNITLQATNHSHPNADSSFSIRGALYADLANVRLTGVNMSDVTVEPSTQSSEYAAESPIVLENTQALIQDSTFKDCSGIHGGALMVVQAASEDCIVSVERTSFLNNVALRNGGAVAVGTRDLFSARTTISGVVNSTVRFSDCLFSKNSAMTGGAVDVSRGLVVFTSSNFSENSALIQGGFQGSVILSNHQGSWQPFQYVNCTYLSSSEGNVTAEVWDSGAAAYFLDCFFTDNSPRPGGATLQMSESCVTKNASCTAGNFPLYSITSYDYCGMLMTEGGAASLFSVSLPIHPHRFQPGVVVEDQLNGTYLVEWNSTSLPTYAGLYMLNATLIDTALIGSPQTFTVTPSAAVAEQTISFGSEKENVGIYCYETYPLFYVETRDAYGNPQPATNASFSLMLDCDLCSHPVEGVVSNERKGIRNATYSLRFQEEAGVGISYNATLLMGGENVVGSPWQVDVDQQPWPVVDARVSPPAVSEAGMAYRVEAQFVLFDGTISESCMAESCVLAEAFLTVDNITLPDLPSAVVQPSCKQGNFSFVFNLTTAGSYAVKVRYRDMTLTSFTMAVEPGSAYGATTTGVLSSGLTGTIDTQYNISVQTKDRFGNNCTSTLLSTPKGVMLANTTQPLPFTAVNSDGLFVANYSAQVPGYYILRIFVDNGSPISNSPFVVLFVSPAGSLCPPGEWSSRGREPCMGCPVGTFSSEPGSVNCTACPADTTTAPAVNATSESDCLCDVGYYGSSPSDCVECLPVCYGCNEACSGGTSCYKGYDGELCLACRDDYFPWGSYCNNCYTGIGAQTIIVLIVFLFIIIFVVLFSRAILYELWEMAFRFYKLAAVFERLHVVWPLPSLYAFAVLAVFNFTMELLALPCYHISHYAALVVSALTPLAMLICTAVACLCYTKWRSMIPPDSRTNSTIDPAERILLEEGDSLDDRYSPILKNTDPSSNNLQGDHIKIGSYDDRINSFGELTSDHGDRMENDGGVMSSSCASSSSVFSANVTFEAQIEKKRSSKVLKWLAGSGWFSNNNIEYSAWDRFVHYTVAYLDYLFVPLAQLSLASFDCIQVGNGTWVVHDYTGEACYDATWWQFRFPLSLLMFVVYVLGIPAVLGSLLYTNKDRLGTPRTAFRIGVLYQRYKPEYFWWSLAIKAEELMIVSSIMLIPNGLAQLLVVSAAIFLIMVWTGIARPYLRTLHFFLELGSSGLKYVLVLAGAMVINGPDAALAWTGSVLIYIAIAIPALVTIALLFFVPLRQLVTAKSLQDDRSLLRLHSKFHRDFYVGDDEEESNLLGDNRDILKSWQIDYNSLNILFPPIAHGAMGVVNRAVYNGTMVAVKSFICGPSGVSTDEFHKEIRTLSTLHHPNIVLFIGFTSDPPSIVQEFAERGSLYDAISVHNTTGEMGWNRRLSIARDSARGMIYLHAQKPPILHRDLKSGNILVWHLVLVCL